MTREEQIKEASKGIHACEVRCVIAFEQGAKWADANLAPVQDKYFNNMNYYGSVLQRLCEMAGVRKEGGKTFHDEIAELLEIVGTKLLTRQDDMTIIYRVSNKAFQILFSKKEDAETFLMENGSISNGMMITEVQVF